MCRWLTPFRFGRRKKAGSRVDDGAATRDSRGEWVPRVLQAGQPFVWPPQPAKLLRFLIGFPGFLWPFGAAFYYGLAWLTWRFLQPGAPDLATFTQLRADWILPMYARNVVMLLVLAGVWHVVLYWRRSQDTRFKYNKRWPSTKSKAFLFNNQTWDNMFWSIASGATIWTLYEVLLLWAYGHGVLPFADLRTNPVWHFAFFLVLPFWQDFHFYVVHRITHWKPLYKAAHYLHHRNTNVGPWSGLSMHPIEHLLYFTRWIILLVVPSHPIHMLYLMQRPAIGPAVGHAGFDQLVLKKDFGHADLDRQLLPLPAPPPLRVQLRHHGHPVRPVVRLVPRRHAGVLRTHAAQAADAARRSYLRRTVSRASAVCTYMIAYRWTECQKVCGRGD